MTPPAPGAMPPLPRQPHRPPALAGRCVPGLALPERAGICPRGAQRPAAGRAPRGAAEPEPPRGRSEAQPGRAGPAAATVRERGRKEGRKETWGTRRGERGAPTPYPGTRGVPGAPTTLDGTRGVPGAAPTPRRQHKESRGQAGAAGQGVAGSDRGHRGWSWAAARGRSAPVCPIARPTDTAPARGAAPQPGLGVRVGPTASPGDTNLGTPTWGHRPVSGTPPRSGGLPHGLPGGPTAPGTRSSVGVSPGTPPCRGGHRPRCGGCNGGGCSGGGCSGGAAPPSPPARYLCGPRPP